MFLGPSVMAELLVIISKIFLIIMVSREIVQEYLQSQSPAEEAGDS